MNSNNNYTTALPNLTDVFNETYTYQNSTAPDEDVYFNIVQICLSFLLVCCLLAMCVNSLVIISIYWIRNPMTPNLKISLSLAVADALSSSMTGMLLLLDKIQIQDAGMFPCVAELIRLSGIVITVLHLLALSFNHYIGIMKPLHYNVIVTKRKVSIVIAFLWVCPIILLVAISTIENNGRSLKSNNCSQKAIREQARLQGNIKAVYTTLWILGSCFIGWMPALLFYIITCEDCPINGEALETLNKEYKYEVMFVLLIGNTLVIMKMFANPIIYTIRIKEIKDSTNRMYLAVAGLFCPSRRNNNAYGLAYQPSRKQNSVMTSQIRMNSFRTSTETQVI